MWWCQNTFFFPFFKASCVNSPSHLTTPWLVWEATHACVCFAGFVYNFFLSRCNVCKCHFWRAKYRLGFQGRLGLTMFECVKSGTRNPKKHFVIVSYCDPGCILFSHSRMQQHLFGWHPIQEQLQKKGEKIFWSLPLVSSMSLTACERCHDSLYLSLLSGWSREANALIIMVPSFDYN